MSEALEGMTRCFEIASDKGTYDVEAMRGALLWLSKNVSDEMRDAFWREWEKKGDNQTARSISAAIRAAAEGSE